VLVDVSISNSFVINPRDESRIINATLQSRPFQGCVEDFLSGTSFLDHTVPEFDPGRESLLKNLIFHWSNGPPEGFDANGPTLVSLAYYPLRTVAAE